MEIKYKAMFALAFVVLEVSLWSIFLKIGGSGVGIVPMLFYVFLIGSLASFAVNFAMGGWKGLVKIFGQPKMLLIFVAAGILNDVLTQLFLGIGTLGTNPSVASIVFRSWVIVVAVLTPFFLRQKVKSAQIFATLVGFSGLYIMLSGGTLFSLNSQQAPFIGILFLATLCSSFAILVMNKYNIEPFVAISLFNIASFAFISLLVAATNTSISIAFTPGVVASIVFLGIIAYTFGTALYYYSVKILGALLTGNAFLSVPFLTILFSFLILGTQIEAYYIAAALLISAGVVLQRRYSDAPERITRKRVLDQVSIFDVTSAFVSNKNSEIGAHISGGNRAFAIRLDADGFSEKSHADTFGKYSCISFTNKKPHREAQREEIEFINEIMALKNEEVALIGLGNPQKLEDAFAEFISTSQQKIL